MRAVQSNYRDDGRPAVLIEIEQPDDYDELVRLIETTDYYGGDYHARHSGQQDGLLISHLWVVAEMVRFLRPRRVLDVGCGRGDVLRVLREVFHVDVLGIDISADVVEAAWPSIRDDVRRGDLTGLLPMLLDEHPEGAADVLCGFDIWEHLHPASLGDAVESLCGAGTDDALALVVLPAYGVDRVFGEEHPFPFEVNRPELEAHRPWRFLYADPADLRIPYAGHLTWADTVWWEQQFAAHGLVRHEALERVLHAGFDGLLPPSVRSFYLLTRTTAAARSRAEGLARRRVTLAAQAALAARVCLAPRRHGFRFDRSFRREVAQWWLSRPGPAPAVARTTIGRLLPR